MHHNLQESESLVTRGVSTAVNGSGEEEISKMRVNITEAARPEPICILLDIRRGGEARELNLMPVVVTSMDDDRERSWKDE